MTETDIADQLRNDLRRLTHITVALFLGLLLVGWWGWHNSANDRHALQREEARTSTALCTLRADLKQRVKSSEKFLADHPHGIPGITAGTIRASLNGQQRTVKALAGLQCGTTTT